MTQTTAFTRVAAFCAAAVLVTTAAACSSDEKNEAATAETTTSATAAASSAAASSSPVAEVDLPTAVELNAVMAIATDPSAPVEQKINTVQGGENAPELFETMTKSKQDSGANFVVVDPVLPGYTPDSVLATVNFTLPDQAPQTVSEVEFVREGGHWKLAQAWACTLITSAVTPDLVPPMCQTAAPAAGAEAPAAPAK